MATAMQAQSMGGAMQQLQGFAKGMTIKQWALLGGGALLVVIALFAFVRLTAKPEMKPLMTGLDPADAQQLAQRLNEKKIPNEVGADGTSVSVSVDKMDQARLLTASGAMPRSGRLGFEIFDHPNWASTDFNERVNYQRALEGELERTIQTMDHVAAARVHIVLPSDSVFADRKEEAKATVVVKLRGGEFNNQDNLTIARLVAGSVERLKPENVTVVDGDTNRSFTPGLDPIFGLGGDGKSADEVLSERLVRTLETVVGQGKVRANVRVEYDNSTSDENAEVYDPKSQVAVSNTHTEERNGMATIAGAPGTASNVPGARPAGRATTQSNGNDQSSSLSESNAYVVNHTVTHTVRPAGQVQRISVAVLVDDSVNYVTQGGRQVAQRSHRGADQMAQITDLAKAAIGLDMARGDVISVQNISFDAPAPAVETPLTPTQNVEKQLRKWWFLLKYLAWALLFLLVYMVLLRSIKRQVMIKLGWAPSLKSASAKQLAGKKGEGLEAAGAQGADGKPMQLNAEGVPISALPHGGPTAPELTESRVVKLKSDIEKYIDEEPLLAANLVQSWMREDE